MLHPVKRENSCAACRKCRKRCSLESEAITKCQRRTSELSTNLWPPAHCAFPAHCTFPDGLGRARANARTRKRLRVLDLGVPRNSRARDRRSLPRNDVCQLQEGNNADHPNDADADGTIEMDAVSAGTTKPGLPCSSYSLNDDRPGISQEDHAQPMPSYAGIELIVDHTTRDDSSGSTIRKENFHCTLNSPNHTLSTRLLQDPITMQYLSAFAARYPNLRRIVIKTDSVPLETPPCGRPQEDPVLQTSDYQFSRNLRSGNAAFVSSRL